MEEKVEQSASREKCREGDVYEVTRQTRSKKLRDRQGGKKHSTRQEVAAVIIIQVLAPSLPSSKKKKKKVDIDMSSKWSGD